MLNFTSLFVSIFRETNTNWTILNNNNFWESIDSSKKLTVECERIKKKKERTEKKTKNKQKIVNERIEAQINNNKP